MVAIGIPPMVHRGFERPQQFQLIGGLTGAGKTNINERAVLGEQIIDLERLPKQRLCLWSDWESAAPSQQLFENTWH